MAYPSTWILRNVAAREFWDAIGIFDPIPYWEKINVSSLVLYGQDDTNRAFGGKFSEAAIFGQVEH